jgi:Protein of unknown function (DUF2569)
MNETSSVTNGQPDLSNSTDGQPQYKGVSGWLLIFCIVQVIVNPVLVLRSLGETWYENFQRFQQIPGLLTFAVLDTVLILGVTAFSIYAGESLWSIRAGAVKIAKRYLLTVLGYYIVGVGLPFIIKLSPTTSDKLFLWSLVRLVMGAIFVSLWYSYFNKSKRVKATYGT